MRILLIAIILLSCAFSVRAECICLNHGVDVNEGKTACVQTSKGGQMALCEKVLNVTSRKFLGQECAVADASRFTPMRHLTPQDLIVEGQWEKLSG